MMIQFWSILSKTLSTRSEVTWPFSRRGTLLELHSEVTIKAGRKQTLATDPKGESSWASPPPIPVNFVQRANVLQPSLPPRPTETCKFNKNWKRRNFQKKQKENEISKTPSDHRYYASLYVLQRRTMGAGTTFGRKADELARRFAEARTPSPVHSTEIRVTVGSTCGFKFKKK